MEIQEISNDKLIAWIDALNGQVIELKEAETLHKKVESALQASEEKFKRFFNNAPVGLRITNVQGDLLNANKYMQNLLGYTLDELMAINANEFYLDQHARQQLLDKLHKGDPVSNFETRIKHRDGSALAVLLNSEAINLENEKIILTSLHDITDLKKTDEELAKRRAYTQSAGISPDIMENKLELQEAYQEMAACVSELKEGIVETSLLSELVEQLQSCQNIEEICSISSQYVQKLFPASQGALFLIDPIKDIAEAVSVWGDSVSTEKMFIPWNCWAIRRGRLHLVDDAHPGLLCGHIYGSKVGQYICIPMMAHGKTMGILHMNYTTPERDQQISTNGVYNEQKARLATAVADHIALTLSNLKQRETLRQQSIRDILTGLFNRRYMEETLMRELHRAEREKKPLGVIMFDIDHFKEFNDQFGHDGGDALLRALGGFLIKRTRGGDIVSRYGGEEFVIVFPSATLEDTRLQAEKLRLGVKDLMVYHLDKPLTMCTLSFGVAAFPEHGSTNEMILKSADTALYRAKNDGRDQVAVASVKSGSDQ